MSKIVAEFDTLEKTLVVTIDGKDVANVREVHFGQSYNNDDEFSCLISTMTKDETNDTKEYNQLMAAKSKEASLFPSQPSDYPGFLKSLGTQKGLPSGKNIIKDICEFFSKEA